VCLIINFLFKKKEEKKLKIHIWPVRSSFAFFASLHFLKYWPLYVPGSDMGIFALSFLVCIPEDIPQSSAATEREVLMLFSPVSKKGCYQTSEEDGGWGRTFLEAVSNGKEYITASLIREFLIKKKKIVNF
jgi:hypothetical protein